MLSFRLRLSDLSFPSWHWLDDRWVNRESWIKPMANSVLARKLAIDETGQACVLVNERNGAPVNTTTPSSNPVSVAQVGALAAEARRCMDECVTVEMKPGWVRVTAGMFGTAPLYLCALNGVLTGSWHLPDLRHLFSADRLLDRSVVRALTRQHRYSPDTLFTNVHRLTERASVTFTATRFNVDYPLPAVHVMQPRQLRPNTDVVNAMHTLVARIVAKVPALPDQVGVELSGGADSANVALAVAATRDDIVRSYGLVVEGDIGELQHHRRAALIAKLGLHDVEIRAGLYPPFTPGGLRMLGVPHDPSTAYYREAFDAVRDAATAHGTRVMFTGVGGDEVNALYAHERISHRPAADPVPWLGPVARAALADVDTNLAPVSPIPLATLMAFSLHNPTYLQAGIWPISPLAHPTVVRFMEQLPVKFRQDKALFRQRLRRAGLPREVASPVRPESFTALMQTGLRCHGLPLLERMLHDSILVDTGYLDRDALVEAYEHALSGERIPSILCDPIAVEVGLRSLL